MDWADRQTVPGPTFHILQEIVRRVPDGGRAEQVRLDDVVGMAQAGASMPIVDFNHVRA